MMARILVLDLNPKPIYPDLSIAYLVTPLRAAGFQVNLQMLAGNSPVNAVAHPTVQAQTHQAPLNLDLNLTKLQAYLEHQQPALILIPNFLNHYAVIQLLAKYAQQLQLPLILGGGCFNIASLEDLPLWLNIQGVSAVFVGEADWVIADLVETILNKQDLSLWPGIYQNQQDNLEFENITAPPLQELERLPIPDLSDFAWQHYPAASIPILTGRTVHLANQPTLHNSRPVQAVLDELAIQAEHYQRKRFIFLDSSLNTNLAMWHGLIDRIQHTVPHCQWMASLYLDKHDPLGLDFNTLVAARAAGLRHLTINLAASQMLKQGKLVNTAVDANRELIACAYQAGLSVRCLVNHHPLPNNLASHLVDQLNINEGRLRKLIEAELKMPQIQSDSPLNSQAASKQTTKSFWQQYKLPFFMNNNHPVTEANSLV